MQKILLPIVIVILLFPVFSIPFRYRLYNLIPQLLTFMPLRVVSEIAKYVSGPVTENIYISTFSLCNISL